MAKLPPTWAELLAVADAKLYRQPSSGMAKRIFAAAGDEILDDDYDLIGAHTSSNPPRALALPSGLVSRLPTV